MKTQKSITVNKVRITQKMLRSSMKHRATGQHWISDIKGQEIHWNCREDEADGLIWIYNAGSVHRGDIFGEVIALLQA